MIVKFLYVAAPGTVLLFCVILFGANFIVPVVPTIICDVTTVSAYHLSGFGIVVGGVVAGTAGIGVLAPSFCIPSPIFISMAPKFKGSKVSYCNVFSN